MENEIILAEKQEIAKPLISWTPEQVDLIKRTVAKGTSDDEFMLYLYQAQKTGLDPLAKQVHAIMRWDTNANRNVMAIQTGIDGYRLIADRTGDYAGSDEPHFFEGEKYPNACVVTVYKIVRGVRCPFTATAYWSEYYPGDDKKGFFWRKMPHGQLAKCAEALALRKAFPAELSGVYTHEEMQQAGEIVNAEDVTIKPEIKQDAEPEKQPTSYPQNLQKLVAAMMSNAAKLPEIFKKDVRQVVAKKTELTDEQLAEWLAAIDFHLESEATK